MKRIENNNPQPNSGETNRVKVLVIDDDDVAREFMCGILREAGYMVFDLRSPIGATRQLLKEKIHVVVIDVVIPALRGDRLARLLRGNPKFDKLGVVLVSGDVTVQLREIASEIKAIAVVEKANIRQQLVAAVSGATAISPNN